MKKTMPKGNREPKGDEFHKHDFKPVTEVPLRKLADKPVCIRLEVHIDKILRNLPQKERIIFLRQSITDAVIDKYGNVI